MNSFDTKCKLKTFPSLLEKHPFLHTRKGCFLLTLSQQALPLPYEY